MILTLLLAVPLFTYGTALIEAGANERGEAFLTSLLSTDISLEMKNRILYNLAVSALERGSLDESLGNFQALNNIEDDLKPFVKAGIQKALAEKKPPAFIPLAAAPSHFSLKETLSELSFLSKDLTALPFNEAEKTSGYHQLQERLALILQKKEEWWGSVVDKQRALLSKGCALKHWEEIVEKLGEGTGFLQKAKDRFNRGGKPYAEILPFLQEAIKLLQEANQALDAEAPLGTPQPQTERFELLTEMFRKDRKAVPPPPKDALW